jgi:hypothetical protein
MKKWRGSDYRSSFNNFVLLYLLKKMEEIGLQQ